METKSLKVTYYKDEDFVFDFELNDEGVFLHCNVSNWKPSVLKRMYNVFASFTLEMEKHNVKNFMTVSPNPKFAKLFGGTVIHKGYIDDVLHEVIQWEVVH